MDDKWPLANGNYSTAANWNGGTLPVDGDVIYLDNRTITLDQNIDLPNADLRTTQRSGGTAGGNLTWSSGTYRIRLREIRAGSSIVVTTGGTSGVTFGTGTIFQGSDTTSARAVSIGGTSLVTFESGCQARNGVGGGISEGITFATPCTITGFLDAICQASVGTSQAVSFSAAANITITGAIQHGFAATTIQFSSAIGTWTVTNETCVGTTTTNGAKIISGSTSLTIIRQSPTVFLFPTTWTTTHITLISASAQSFEYRGDIEQPTSAAIQWSNTSANGVFRHRGTIYGSNPLNTIAMLIGSAGGSKFVLDKLAPNSVSGRMPVLGAGWCLRSNSQIISSTESTNVTLVPSTSVGDPPAIANVRSGTTYHFGTLTGTCAVPGASSVAAGVPVDATVGTAVLTSSAVQSGCNSALLAYDTNGVASVNDLESIGVDLAPVLAKLPESGRAATQASVDAIAVGLSGSAPVEPTGRIARGGTVTAYIGDDFRVRSETQLDIPVTDPAAALKAKLEAIGLENLFFGASPPNGDPGAIAGTIAAITASAGLTTISVEIINCGADLMPGSIPYQIQSSVAHGSEFDDFVRLDGTLTLKPRAVAVRR